MGGGYDVFVSYSSPDRPVVERIAQRLRDAGLEPWLSSCAQGDHAEDERAANLKGPGPFRFPAP